MSMTRRERTLRLLPPPLKAAAKQARHAVDPVFVWNYRRQTHDDRPIPPSAIRARSGNPSIAAYVPGGAEAVAEVEAVLSRVGARLADFGTVYDFGCGAGRVLRHVAALAGPGTRCSGSDVDAGAIAWADAHLPDLDVRVNDYRPPLPFPDDSFDFLYSISIFTHLNEEMQMEWLREMSRVLRPGGLGLLTVHGAYAFEECRTGRVVSNTRGCSQRIQSHADLEAEGFVYEGYEISGWNRRDFPGISETFGMAFHSPEYVEKRWSEIFEVVAIVPRSIGGGWQDSVVVRNRG